MKKMLFFFVAVGFSIMSAGQDMFRVRQLTFDPAQEGFATWAPDGRSIVYQYTDLKDTLGKNGLREMSVDHTGLKHIFNGIAEHARWSPDNKYIVFDADTGNSIRMVPAGGGDLIRFLPDSVKIQNGGLPCWSPDGSQIAFFERKGESLCTYNLKTHKLKSLFREEGKLPLPGGWWNDGKSILVALMDRKTRKSTILRISSDGKEKTQITGHHENFYRHLALSPDGSLLVYAALNGKYLGLYIMSAEGGKSLPLTVTENSHNEGAAWSPDGRHITFTSTRSGSFDIWIMDVAIDEVKEKLQTMNNQVNNERELFNSLKNNDLPKVKALVEADHQLLDTRDESGNTPLHLAVTQKQYETVSYLLNEGADVNCGNTNHLTPLHLSSRLGSHEITRLLIEKGADVRLADFQLYTPLHYASANGFKEVTEILVKSGAPLEVKNSYGRTPLLLCARERGTPETARLLIDAGADVNVKDKFESTPLELAAWRGYKDIVGVLIEKGAEIPVTGLKARAILICACQQGLPDLFRKQVEKGIDITILNNSQGSLFHNAAKGGSSEIVEALINKGLKMDSKDKFGWTPLHYAAMNNHVNVLQTLLDNGANINARNLMGQTAFNVADEFMQIQSKEFLIKKGSDQRPMQFPLMEGEYLGQVPPDDTPVIFAPGIISSIWGLHSSLAFSPDATEVYWSPMIELQGQPYSIGNILFMKKVSNRWTPPQLAPFSGVEGITDGEPFFSHDGNRLYFNSMRPNPEQDNGRKENIWYVDRTQSGWSDPKPVSPVINMMNLHWQFSVDKKGNIYFASDNTGGFGMQDIYCSSFRDGEYEKPKNLGEDINNAENDMTPFISPEGDYLIYCRGTELRISFLNSDGTWSESKSLSSNINTGFELCPLVTPDKKYLVFLSGREGESHPFWVSAKVIEELRPKD